MFCFVVLFWKFKRAAHTDTQGLSVGNISIGAILFVLNAVVGVTMGSGFLTRTQSLFSVILIRFSADRACDITPQVVADIIRSFNVCGD